MTKHAHAVSWKLGDFIHLPYSSNLAKSSKIVQIVEFCDRWSGLDINLVFAFVLLVTDRTLGLYLPEHVSVNWLEHVSVNGLEQVPLKWLEHVSGNGSVELTSVNGSDTYIFISHFELFSLGSPSSWFWTGSPSSWCWTGSGRS